MKSFSLKCLFSFALTVALTAVVFLSSPLEPQQTDLSSFGIVPENYLWSKKSITVCWADKRLSEELPQFSIMRTVEQEITAELSAESKRAVQNKVQEQFKISSVGLEFVGWKTCDPSVKSDIYIFAFDEMAYAEYYAPGEADIGTSCQMFNAETRKKEIRHRGEGQPGYVFLSLATIKKLGSKTYKNSDVSFLRASLHEFGHVSGLLHEHEHPQAKKDPNCELIFKENPKFFSQTTQLGKINYYSEYDPTSIMNGCFLLHEDQNENQTFAKVHLSELDRHTLQCLYKNDDQYDKSKCHLSDTK